MKKVITMLTDNNVVVSLNTNLTLLDDDVVSSQLNGCEVTAGLYFIKIFGHLHDYFSSLFLVFDSFLVVSP